MTPDYNLATALQALTSPSQYDNAGKLAKLLIALSNGDITAQEFALRIRSDNKLLEVFNSFEGQEVQLSPQSIVSFGKGNNTGDISIQDVIGNNQININVYQQNSKPTTLSNSKIKPSQYPYETFQKDFRGIVAPKRYQPGQGVLHVVLGRIADIRNMPVVIPINQDFDFEQRGIRSVMYSFSNILIKGHKFYDVLEEIWPVHQRPKSVGLGETKWIELPPNSQDLPSVLFTVTTRNLSPDGRNYGRYVNTPLEGFKVILDCVFETVDDKSLEAIALPLLGTGYANIGRVGGDPKLLQYLQQAALCVTIERLEEELSNPEKALNRAVIVVFSERPHSHEEHQICECAIQFIAKDKNDRKIFLEKILNKLN
jgi:hypothetical protein